MIDPPNPALTPEVLRRGLEVANIPVLLLLLFQTTGQFRWLREPYRPHRSTGLTDNPTGGLSKARQDEVRQAAFDAIQRYSAGTPLAYPRPPDGLLVEMLSTSMGERVPQEYGPMIADDLGLSPDSRLSGLQPPSGFRALIIGAGPHGIAAGVALHRAGVPFEIIERRSEVGGTWLENRYPGCGVDTPTAIYSFSFQQHMWSKYFALRDEMLGYLRDTADSVDLQSRIRFDEEVVSARYDAGQRQWMVETRTSTGTARITPASVVISAVGAFNQPKMPHIDGLGRFAGRIVHTAEWPDDVELDGKRVAVIGAGASAMQVVPAIAGRVAHLDVVQRTPHWVAPFERFGTDIAVELRELSNALPLYRMWDRIRWGWTFNDRLFSALQKDPTWPNPERSINAENDRHRQYFTKYIESELGDRPDLLPSVVPSYPPYGKRILLDNGWYHTLTRANVTLVPDAIVAVTDAGKLVTAGGRELTVDVLICATGFNVVRYLGPIEVLGRDGTSIHDLWGQDDARAYMGMTVPNFPNFFMLYGPNVAPGHGGSIIGVGEMQIDYLIRLLREMFDQDIDELECRPDVWRQYNERVDAAHEQMIWTHTGMTTYYRNSKGRVVVPGPFRVVDVWRMSQTPALDDYNVRRGRSAVDDQDVRAASA